MDADKSSVVVAKFIMEGWLIVLRLGGRVVVCCIKNV
jgi:hypothetical protein